MFAYGVGDLGPAIVASINGFFLNAFLIEVAGLRPAYAAVIFLLVKIWDSVNDPIIGTLTDRTNTRWGRRRPWLLFGAVPFGLAFFLQWIVPDLSELGRFWYYLVVAVLLDTGFTAVNVPYAALTPELTQDYDERTTLNSYRFSFSILGGVFAAFFHTIIVSGYADRGAILTGYLISAGIWAAVIVASNVITFAFTRESAFETDAGPQLGFRDGLRIAFANRPFVLVTVIYLLSWLAIQFVQNNLILYVNYWSGGTDVFQFLLLILQGMAFVFLLVWSRVSKRIGKKRVYYIGVSAWIAASVLLFLVPRGGYVWLFPIAVIAAVGVSVCYLIPWSMLPDVVDLDELRTGRRREGIFYGFFVFLQKLGISLGIAFSNLILDWTGYLKPAYPGAPLVQDQPEAVLLALRSFVSIAPIFILIAGMLVVRRYPITRERHAEILRTLRSRRDTAHG
jgi:GPH family glycoside/pentoside/hexuronide:cation symporter